MRYSDLNCTTLKSDIEDFDSEMDKSDNLQDTINVGNCYYNSRLTIVSDLF